MAKNGVFNPKSQKNRYFITFFAILRGFIGQKIFLTPESCFSAIFTPRNDVFRKNFFSKKWPSKVSKVRFFLHHPVMISHYNFSPKMTKISIFHQKGPKIEIFFTKIEIFYKKNSFESLVYNFFVEKLKKIEQFW